MSKEIEDIAYSFMSFEKMYDDFIEGGVDALYHPKEIGWMLEYFEKLEDYEKCNILKQNKDE